VSPVSFLEIAILSEFGRLEADVPALQDAVRRDSRFIADDIPLTTLISLSLSLSWTRDPFDRMIVAHSLARSAPLCTLDRRIREHHRLVAPEIEEVC
jgi:PIN domain nuclease of toxin-antitoxin system